MKKSTKKSSARKSSKSRASRNNSRKAVEAAGIEYRRNWKPGAKVRMVNDNERPFGKTLKVLSPHKDEYRPLPKSDWHLVGDKTNYLWQHYTQFAAA